MKKILAILMILRMFSSIMRILVRIESQNNHDKATGKLLECPSHVLEVVTGPLALGIELS